VIRAGKKQEPLAARKALELVADDIPGPLRFEQIFKRTARLHHSERTLIDYLDQLASDIAILAWRAHIHALGEALTFGAHDCPPFS